VRKWTEAPELLVSSLDRGQIADRQAMSPETILGYLDQMIGVGRLRKSKVLFSLDNHRRRKPHTKQEQEIARRCAS
jgi:DNA-binding CsgD family transcriptional regulator